MLFAEGQGFDIVQVCIQGGGFGLLALVLIWGGPMLLRTQKDHVDQLIAIFREQQDANKNQQELCNEMFRRQQEAHERMIAEVVESMDGIKTAMTEISGSIHKVHQRIDNIDCCLEIDSTRVGKRGV
jgi:hypothetical protein